jgi:hypothetical protein
MPGVQTAGVHGDEVDAVLAEQGEHVGLLGAVAEERIVAQLDGIRGAGGQGAQEALQPRQLGWIEPRWQLEEQRAELLAQRRSRNVATSAAQSTSSLSWLISRGNLKQNRNSSGT